MVRGQGKWISTLLSNLLINIFVNGLNIFDIAGAFQKIKHKNGILHYNFDNVLVIKMIIQTYQTYWKFNKREW